MGLFAWTIIGALVGYAAASRKGFNVVGGILGGAVLGLLSPLLFLVSGITRADIDRKKCPYCAEFIKGEAKVCKHCGKEQPEPAPATR